MIEANEEAPDIEKMDRQEFVLDTDELQHHKEEVEKQTSAVRDEMEMADLEKMYLRELIKKECWDDMAVKGRSVKVSMHYLTCISDCVICQLLLLLIFSSLFLIGWKSVIIHCCRRIQMMLKSLRE